MKFGITQAFDCSYLPDKKEQLLVCVEPKETLSDIFSQLTQSGFRRSGEQIYRPHCNNCSACQSIRVISRAFSPSKSQKRVLSKNRDIQIKISDHDNPDYYPLYERYINEVHNDGAMFPATYEQYTSFVNCEWNQPLFIEGYIKDELIGVAVTDVLDDGYSALYTFFNPELSARSLGTFFILQQIALCAQQDKAYLYLGYQIDDCRKMNYKKNFYPTERFIHDKWVLSPKNE
ncbi:arginyltransferase [Glaciecola sp. MH2013]|uniref:arginyltransferase n=1 Tax=Glaciecola sp. MH2013 TaxID=2785524 RepID=UPI0018A067EE|nr:arginyltransferase [Glaciecola sp. MH2013]MBF7072581.1 arginyltransferase [Glaciecola sp. MH2013]